MLCSVKMSEFQGMNLIRIWNYYLITVEPYPKAVCFKKIRDTGGNGFRTVVAAVLENPCLEVVLQEDVAFM